MRWTPAQEAAIEARHSNLLVSAAAGSGKTAVLVGRILSLIEEGVGIDEMLIVTFTKAAAAEMRGRVLTVLHEQAEIGKAGFAEQAMRIERADISTLHSFCGKVCREQFQHAGIDPGFRVGDGAEMSQLKIQAVEESLLGLYERPSEAFAQLRDCMELETLYNAILELHAFLMARPDPWQWLEAAIAAHDVDEESLKHSPWMATLVDAMKNDLHAAIALYAEAESVSSAHQLFVPFTREEKGLLFAMEEIIAMGFDTLREADPFSLKPRRPAKPKDADDEVIKAYDKSRDRVKDRLKAMNERMEWLKNLRLRAEDERATLRLWAGLAEAVRAFHERFAEKKAERNVLDFHDMEHFALSVLRDDRIAGHYQSRYRFVFIDEYQDSSLIQEAIIGRIVREDNLFMVGDVKQSIYRFRLAEPALFLAKMETFSDEPGAIDRRVLLNANFRSEGPIIQGINDVFDHVFCGGKMEIQYGEESRLIQGKEEEGATEPIELHIIQKEMEQAESDGEAEERAEIQLEAEVIAARIRQILSEGKHRLADIAILMRTVRGKAAGLMETLKSRGIPVWCDIGEDILERGEVKTILSLLKIIDNFHQDIPLIAVLKSSIVGLQDETLAKIRIRYPEGTFAQAAMLYSREEDEIAAALRAFIKRIRKWADYAAVMRLDQFIRALYSQTDLPSLVGSLPEGSVRQKNLTLIAEYAGDYQKAQGGGISGFLRYVERVRSREGISAKEIGEGDNVVRVMSIHKSKGLQFPIVFLAGMGGGFAGKRDQQKLVMHAELGLGMQHMDPQSRVTQRTLSQEAIREKRRQEGIAEEARILYVAMTRPESRLIMIGTEKKPGQWSKGPTPPAEFGASQMDWVYPVASRSPEWQVTLHERAIGAKQAERADIKQLIASVKKAPESAAWQRAEQMLSWEAEKSEIRQLKRSVTAVVRAEPKEGEDAPFIRHLSEIKQRPGFIENKRMDAAERGNALHTFLRLAPLAPMDIEAVCQALLKRGILSEAEIGSLPMRSLTNFSSSSLWRRIISAKTVKREWSFNLKVMEQKGRTLLQGVIDCCFLEDGEWVIVDYKTDRKENIAALKDKYAEQVERYAAALEAITKTPVKEKIVYFLSAGEAYTL